MWTSVGNGCTEAKGNKYAEVKFLGTPGFMLAMKLVHKSGYVSCAIDGRRSNWGCAAASTDIRMVVTDDKNQVIYPSPQLVANVHKYTVPGFTSSSPELVLSNFAYPTYLSTGSKLRVWYSEDLMDTSEFDNHGKTCMDIYAYMQNIPCNIA